MNKWIIEREMQFFAAKKLPTFNSCPVVIRLPASGAVKIGKAATVDWSSRAKWMYWIVIYCKPRNRQKSQRKQLVQFVWIESQLLFSPIVVTGHARSAASTWTIATFAEAQLGRSSNSIELIIYKQTTKWNYYCIILYMLILHFKPVPYCLIGFFFVILIFASLTSLHH